MILKITLKFMEQFKKICHIDTLKAIKFKENIICKTPKL